jgi:thiosulfate reductase cytochrome b subunit
MATRLSSERGKLLHPLPVRIMHWVNALAMIIMIGSGWKIYNDEVLFGWLHFPEWMTVGGEAQGALQWHFFAMWLLMANGLIYIGYGLFTGRFRRKLLPIRPREVLADVGEALRFRLSHQDMTRYNAVQRLLYTGIILVIIEIGRAHV